MILRFLANLAVFLVSMKALISREAWEDIVFNLCVWLCVVFLVRTESPGWRRPLDLACVAVLLTAVVTLQVAKGAIFDLVPFAMLVVAASMAMGQRGNSMFFRSTEDDWIRSRLERQFVVSDPNARGRLEEILESEGFDRALWHDKPVWKLQLSGDDLLVRCWVGLGGPMQELVEDVVLDGPFGSERRGQMLRLWRSICLEFDPKSEFSDMEALWRADVQYFARLPETAGRLGEAVLHQE